MVSDKKKFNNGLTNQNNAMFYVLWQADVSNLPCRPIRLYNTDCLITDPCRIKLPVPFIGPPIIARLPTNVIDSVHDEGLFRVIVI